MRILRSLILMMVALFACAGAASAAQITVQAQQIPNVFFPGVSATSPPRIRIYYSKTFTSSTNTFILGGAPNGQGASNVYLEIITTWAAGVVSMPSFSLVSTDDALDDRTATCSFFWFGAQGNYLGPVQGLNNLVIFHSIASSIGCSPAGTCAFFVDLRLANTGLIPSNPTATYSAPVIDQKISAALGLASGIHDPSSNGLLSRTALNTVVSRSLASGSSPNLTVANSDGVSGNPTVSLGANIVTAGGAVFNVKAYGAVGDGSTDDTTAIQAAITAAQLVNGTVYLPAGNYKITSVLTISNSVTLAGAGVHPIYGSIDDDLQQYATTLPIRSPYLVGSVLVQSTAATNAIQITAQGRAVNLRDFGIKFANAIAFRNTGHGIKTLPPNMSDGFPDWGVIGARWDNVMVWGHDGNHYAFSLTNPSLMTLVQLEGWGGGGLEIHANTNITSPGNLTCIQAFFVVLAGGTSHGFYLHHTGANPGVNLSTFDRPQCNMITVPNVFNTPFPGIASTTTAQKMFVMDASTPFLNLIHPDFESNQGSGVTIVTTASGFFMTPGFIEGGLYPQGELWTQTFYSTSDGIRLRNGATNEFGLLHVSGNSYLDTIGTLNFRSNLGTPRATLAADGTLAVLGGASALGSLGVGTASPGAKLDVRGNGQFLSGNAAVAAQTLYGRTSEDFTFGIAGGANDYVTGTVAGDAAARAMTNLFLAAGGSSNAVKFDGTNFAPSTDNTLNLGTASKRWALVRGVVITSGDLVLSDKQTGEELYKIHEDAGNIYFDDARTGRQLMRLDREGNLHLRGRLIQEQN